MPENFNRSAVYKEKQVVVHISTKKVFPMLKCSTTYYEHVEEILQQQDSYTVSNFTFYKADSVLIVDTNEITCSTITLQVKCHVGSRPFSFSVSTAIDCNSFQTIGKFNIRRKWRPLCNLFKLICPCCNSGLNDEDAGLDVKDDGVYVEDAGLDAEDAGLDDEYTGWDDEDAGWDDDGVMDIDFGDWLVCRTGSGLVGYSLAVYLPCLEP
ncbi:unnamed protein product [Mytilus coruscus]|uniref:Uncharacterized protein n=1 Tax=Mytilus coruscus TaxID=42192 RepID=A0A6J8C0V9_MYTCO|nr:unnamed protein product [Mytilus coruscus]